jgi:uncharacterized RDD family membrane protein YckC
MNAAVAARLRDNSRVRQIVTPEGIALPITLASRGSRFGALLLDLIFIFLLMLFTTLGLIWLGGGVAKIEGVEASDGSARGLLQFFVILWLAAIFLFRNAYFLFFELGPRGATPGKRAVGIRIAARDGGRLSAEMVIARNLLRDIELFLPLVFLANARGGDMGAAGIAATAWFLVFALFPCFNRDRLRAGDVIAGSWVIEAPKRKLETAMSVREATAAPPTYRFGEAELSVYGAYELQTLERILRENRQEAMASVQDAICRKIGWDPGHGEERAFLEAYYTQLRARLETNLRMGKRKADKYTSEG